MEEGATMKAVTAVQSDVESNPAGRTSPDASSSSLLDAEVFGQNNDGRRLAEMAYDEIRTRIITLELCPGEEFTESELTQVLQLGKTPIREALLRLRLEGMVEAQARSGYRVSPVTLKDARDLCELRTLLEGEAARLVATRGQREYWELKPSSVVTPDVTSESTFHSRIEAERHFHETLGSATGNSRLASNLSQVLGHVARLWHLCFALDSRAQGAPLHDHTALLSALDNADPSRACELVVEEARSAQVEIINAMLSSQSIASANVDLREGPVHKFYLDIPRTQA